MNKKLKLLSVGLILLLIGFQYWIVLAEQKTLPSEEWSRSFPSNASVGNYARLQTVPTENGYATSLLDFKSMDLLDCSADIQCTDNWSISELNPYKNTWSDGETTYYIQGESLIRSTTNGENTTVSTDAENFTKSKDTLVYWNKNQEIMVQRGDNEPISYKSEFPVNTVMIVDEHIFVVTKNTQDNLLAVLSVTNNLNELFQFYLGTYENLSSIQIVKADETQFNLLLDTQTFSGGGRHKVLRNASFDLTEKQTLSLTKLEFADKASGAKLFDIRTPFLFEGETGTIITFSAYMYDQVGDKAYKVFAGNYDDERIEASAVTKKGELYVKPIFVNGQTIAYLKLDGKEKKLMYSSSTEEKRMLSEKILDGDYKAALYSLVSLSFVGLVLLLLAFTWLIPSFIIGYSTLALLQKRRKSYAFPIALYANSIALVVSQLVFFIFVFNPERIVLKAPYLTEIWHVALIIVIAGIGCLLPIFLSRTKVTEDNCNQLILLTTGLNLLILFLLLGPYFI